MEGLGLLLSFSRIDSQSASIVVLQIERKKVVVVLQPRQRRAANSHKINRAVLPFRTPHTLFPPLVPLKEDFLSTSITLTQPRRIYPSFLQSSQDCSTQVTMINTTPTTPVAPPPVASNIQYPQSSTTGISSPPGSLRPVLPPATRPPMSLASSRSSSAASTASVSNATSTAAPPPAAGLSFQTMRPGTEWNDLPDEMVALNGDRARSTHLSPPSAGGSAASSRSSSASRSKKKNRSYPAAAFKN